MNQWLNPLKGGTGSNLADMGRATVRVDLYSWERRLRNRLLMSVGRPSLQYCGFGDGEAGNVNLIWPHRARLMWPHLGGVW